MDFILHVRSPEVCAILNLPWLSDMHASRDTVLLADERTFSRQSWPPSPVADQTWPSDAERMNKKSRRCVVRHARQHNSAYIGT